LGNTRIASPKTPPSPPEAPVAVIELMPPPDQGFSGTLKLYATTEAATVIDELKRRGYTVIEP